MARTAEVLVKPTGEFVVKGSREDLVEALSAEGFDELAEALGTARQQAVPQDLVGAVAHAYRSFATEHPAVYDAMFTPATRLAFGAGNSAALLTNTYAEVSEAVATIAGARDVEKLAELLWAALHG